MPPLTKDQILSNIYYDLETGYGSIKNTYDQARKEDSTIKLEDVQTWMKQQPNKQRKGYKGYNSYIPNFPRDMYQIDIADMINLQKSPTQPRYSLVVIDAWSKYALVEPMVNKSSISVYNSLLTIFSKMGKPIRVYSDDDPAFKSKVKEYFEAEAIEHTTTLTHANVAERFIRTFKNAINDRVRFTKSEWQDLIDPVIKRYNNIIHSTTNNTPNDAHQDKNSVSVAVNLYIKSSHKRKYKNINISDDVKIYTKGKDNYTSRKEYNSRWSEKTYKVTNISYDISFNRYYELEGQTKHFLRHELLLID